MERGVANDSNYYSNNDNDNNDEIGIYDGEGGDTVLSSILKSLDAEAKELLLLPPPPSAAVAAQLPKQKRKKITASSSSSTKRKRDSADMVDSDGGGSENNDDDDDNIDGKDTSSSSTTPSPPRVAVGKKRQEKKKRKIADGTAKSVATATTDDNDNLERQHQPPNFYNQSGNDYLSALAPICNIRRRTVVGNVGEVHYKYLPLEESTATVHQWMLQHSDYATLTELRESGLGLKKNHKTRMRTQARQFCTTLDAVDVIQRGVLCNIYLFLILNFNMYSPCVAHMSASDKLSMQNLMSMVFPLELITSIYNHVYAVSKQNNSRKVVSPIISNGSTSRSGCVQMYSIFIKQSGHILHQIIASWVRKRLVTILEGSKMKREGKLLPLEECVARLDTLRANVVRTYKSIDAQQCRLDSVQDLVGLYDFAQNCCEEQLAISSTRSFRTKHDDTIQAVGRLTNLMRDKNRQQQKLRHQQQQQPQQQANNTEEGKNELDRPTDRPTVITVNNGTSNDNIVVVEQVRKTPRTKSSKNANPQVMGGGSVRTNPPPSTVATVVTETEVIPPELPKKIKKKKYVKKVKTVNELGPT